MNARASRWTRAEIGVGCAVLLLGCVGARPAPAVSQGGSLAGGTASSIVPASIAVEVYGALAASVPTPDPTPNRVEVCVDVTASMLHGAAGGRTPLEAARSGATELLGALREGTERAVLVLGVPGSGVCAGSVRAIQPTGAALREALAASSADRAPRAEASLTAMLDDVRRDLERDGVLRRTRVVVFTDLDESCGGDPCRAAQLLIDGGASLEIVPVGDAPPPACLARLLAAPGVPVASEAAVSTTPPAFYVSRAGGDEDPPPVLAIGHAGEGSVAVAPGLVTLLVHLNPPEEIGPFQLDPGEFARIRVLESPGSSGPARVWRIERGSEAVGRAFPPPDHLE